jgi:succinate dehydrogenase/fumarate reductase flavoprotein subunit
MDEYIIQRKARERMAWHKRYEKVGSVMEVCRHFQISRKAFYKWVQVDVKHLPKLKIRRFPEGYQEYGTRPSTTAPGCASASSVGG